MKGNKKIIIIAALLLLIAASYTTYAIYRESVTATGSINTANWSVKLDTTKFSEVQNLTFNLSSLTCTTNPGKNSKVAPGAECYKDYVIDATGSEVDVIVTAELDTTNTTNKPANMEVTLKDAANLSSTAPIKITYNETSMTKTVRLLVKWPGAIEDQPSKDSSDMSDANKAVTLSVKLTARQALSGE